MAYTEIPPVRLRGVGLAFGRHRVFTDLNLEWGGGIVALLGRNGAGKTTMVNLLSTLLLPETGRVEVLGHDTRTAGGRVRGLIGVTGQFSSVDEVLTGRENLLLAARLLGLDARSARTRAGELLERIRLSDAADTRVATWSGGMRRRLDLAMSLLRRPALLFLDEPTTGLDTGSRRELWAQVTELAGEGTAVLLTTQYLEEADALAREVIVLEDGAVVERGAPEQVKAHAGGPVVEAHRHGERLGAVPTDGTARDIAAIAGRFPADAQVSVRRPTLDEAFTRLTGVATRRAEAQAVPPSDRTELQEAS